jgi:hypothetical protein
MEHLSELGYVGLFVAELDMASSVLPGNFTIKNGGRDQPF